MKKLILIICLPFLLHYVAAQDTFSIVAVDSATGEVGSAGASCLDETQITGGVLIISDVLPGKGAIHTQSYWMAANQQNARMRMEAGDSPQEIIDWLENNDVSGNPAIRQYGIVDFDLQNSPRVAAFTGADCLDYKNHILGPDYAIQGNILLGPQILDSMEARFLRTDGSLADKLMAAMQGANIPGADSRCLAEGVSSLSAFLRVAKPDDADDDLWLDLQVPITPYGHEPIDSLQVLYDQWKSATGISRTRSLLQKPVITDRGEYFSLRMPGKNFRQLYSAAIYDITGKVVSEKEFNNEYLIPKQSLKQGIYVVRVSAPSGAVVVARLANFR